MTSCCLQQVEGKPELVTSEDLVQAYSHPEASLAGALLLLATADGAAPSEEAAAAAALTTPPAGPKPLPVVGNMLLYVSVRGGEGAYT